MLLLIVDNFFWFKWYLALSSLISVQIASDNILNSAGDTVTFSTRSYFQMYLWFCPFIKCICTHSDILQYNSCNILQFTILVGLMRPKHLENTILYCLRLVFLNSILISSGVVTVAQFVILCYLLCYLCPISWIFSWQTYSCIV